MTQTLQIGILQANLLWEAPEKNVKAILQQLESTPRQADLWVLPEMFSTGFTMKPQNLGLNETPAMIDALIDFCRQQNTRIAGSVIWKVSQSYVNRFVLMGPNGIEGAYDKHHLFGLSKETESYQAGHQRASWRVNDWSIDPFICYDLRFPEWARNQNHSDLMLFTANWPDSRANHWRSLLIARAIENQCFVVGVNRTGSDSNNLNYAGDSLCVDPNGEIMANLGSNSEPVLISIQKTDMDKIRQKLPFLKDRFPQGNLNLKPHQS